MKDGIMKNGVKRSYNERELTDAFWDYFKKNGRYPFSKEIKSPTIEAYKRVYGSWTNFLKQIDVLGEDDWYKCDEQVLIDNYSTGSQEDILNRLMVKRSWSTVKTKASRLGLKRDKSKIKQIYNDEYLISEMKRFYTLHGRSPTNEDFANNSSFPSPKVYNKRFGWNNALKLAGLPINCLMNHNKDDCIHEAKKFYQNTKRSPYYHELSFSHTLLKNYWSTWNEFLTECNLPLTTDDCLLKSREEGIAFLKDLHFRLGRLPIQSDLKNYKGINVGWYYKEFGTWTQSLLSAGLITEDEMANREQMIKNSIEYLKLLSEKLNRVPTVSEFDKFVRKQDKKAFTRRNLCENLNMTYLEVCDGYLDYQSLDSNGSYGHMHINKDNKRCKSTDEVNISNIFIDNGIEFIYEPSYKDVIKNEECRYKFDWAIFFNDIKIYVEYFGLYYPSDKSEISTQYVNKTHKKIELCNKNNIDLISLYPNDLENEYEGLIQKFNLHGLRLKVMDIAA